MKLDMIGIIVADMNKAITFYQHLGFTTVGEFNNDYMELNNEGVRISLNSLEMIKGVYGFTPNNSGEKIELAFLCQDATTVDETCTKLKSLGYEVFKEPWDAFWGQHYAIVKDVDNNLLALFAN